MPTAIAGPITSSQSFSNWAATPNAPSAGTYSGLVTTGTARPSASPLNCTIQAGTTSGRVINSKIGRLAAMINSAPTDQRSTASRGTPSG